MRGAFDADSICRFAAISVFEDFESTGPFRSGTPELVESGLLVEKGLRRLGDGSKGFMDEGLGTSAVFRGIVTKTLSFLECKSVGFVKGSLLILSSSFLLLFN